ncbi:MAG TPA: hypothetical protein VNQ56_06215 [Pseudolabrys sp.]|nr:hypothetical protein [Pseudolabrys sp.]
MSISGKVGKEMKREPRDVRTGNTGHQYLRVVERLRLFLTALFVAVVVNGEMAAHANDDSITPEVQARINALPSSVQAMRDIDRVTGECERDFYMRTYQKCSCVRLQYAKARADDPHSNWDDVRRRMLLSFGGVCHNRAAVVSHKFDYCIPQTKKTYRLVTDEEVTDYCRCYADNIGDRLMTSDKAMINVPRDWMVSARQKCGSAKLRKASNDRSKKLNQKP